LFSDAYGLELLSVAVKPALKAVVKTILSFMGGIVEIDP